MDEQGFEARAVLTPRRRRLSRALLLVPAVVLVALAVAGIAGPHPREPSANLPAPTGATVSIAPRPVPQRPATALGLAVHWVDELRPLETDPAQELAVAGWYTTTAITGCPALAAIYRDGALPYLRGDADKLAFCVRSGVLYAAEPIPGVPAPTSAPREGPAADPTMSVLAVTVAIGVVMPPEIEVVGADSMEVVVLGRFVPRQAGCLFLRGCGRDFIVDHIAWTPAAST